MIDLAYVREHYNPDDPRLASGGPLLGDGLSQGIDLMLRHCPVARTDATFIGVPKGGWVVNRYEHVMAVLRDPELFSSRKDWGATVEPELIPIDVDPPLLLEYRRLLQPFFTLGAAKPFEPLAREIITRLIDEVIESGRCDDVVSQIAQPFSSEVQWGWLVGVDAVDQKRALEWMLVYLYKHFEPEFDVIMREWTEWTMETIAQRRSGPRRDDLIDALLHAEIEGRPLTDEELKGVIMIMILGGVTTTADAIGNVILRMAVYPELQDRLRSDVTLLPNAIEEFLRLDPPASGPARRCTRDTVLGGQEIKAGDQLFVHLAAANQDPAEFENATGLDLERQANRHLAFGAGHHRCLGATFARQNLRVAFEEILTRLRDIRLIDGDPPRRRPGIVWGPSHLPITFTPGPRAGST